MSIYGERSSRRRLLGIAAGRVRLERGAEPRSPTPVPGAANSTAS